MCPNRSLLRIIGQTEPLVDMCQYLLHTFETTVTLITTFNKSVALGVSGGRNNTGSNENRLIFSPSQAAPTAEP